MRPVGSESRTIREKGATWGLIMAPIALILICGVLVSQYWTRTVWLPGVINGIGNFVLLSHAEYWNLWGIIYWAGIMPVLVSPAVALPPALYLGLKADPRHWRYFALVYTFVGIVVLLLGLVAYQSLRIVSEIWSYV